MSERIRRGLGWSAGGNLLLRAGSFLTSLMVARLIAPEEFGVFAVALTVWNVLGTLAEFGLGSDLVRAQDPERRAPTVATLGVVTSGILATTMFLAAEPMAAAFRSPDASGVIRLMSVALVLFGLSIVPAAMLQREYRQGTLLVVNLTGLLVSVAVILVLGTSGHGPAALAWGLIAQQLATVVGLHVALLSLPRWGFRPEVARESLAFCMPLAVANLVSWLLITLDNLIVARGLSAAELGLYVLAFNVSSWPMTAIGQSIRVVALPAFSGIADPARRNAALVRCSGPVVTVAVLMALGLSTLADPLVRVLYGDRWAAAATALAGLAVFGGVRVVLDLMATFLIAEGRTRAVLAVQLVWLCAMVPAMMMGVAWFGLAGAGWAHVAVGLLVVVPAYGLCLHASGVDVAAFVRAWWRPVGTAVPAAAVCAWIGTRDGHALVLLASGGMAAVVLYALPVLPRWRREVRALAAGPGLGPQDASTGGQRGTHERQTDHVLG